MVSLVTADPHKTKIFDVELSGRAQATYLGQAHFAGTGPEGKTCRECSKWFLQKRAAKGAPPERVHPGYYQKRAKTPFELKPAVCHASVPNKPRLRIPHSALACRHFAQTETPFAPTTQPATKQKKRSK